MWLLMLAVIPQLCVDQLLRTLRGSTTCLGSRHSPQLCWPLLAASLPACRPLLWAVLQMKTATACLMCKGTGFRDCQVCMGECQRCRCFLVSWAPDLPPADPCCLPRLAPLLLPQAKPSSAAGSPWH